MLLTVLGCSGSVPGPSSPSSGYLIDAGGARIAVDLGNGTLGELQKHADPFSLDALLFSHLHPDHCADFSALTVMRRYHPDPPADRVAKLPVYAPEEAPTRFAAQYAPDAEERAETDLSDVYQFHAWPVEAPINGIGVRVARVAHPCEAYGMRFEHESRTIVYTGDSGVCDALTQLAEGADVLLAEASWTHSPDRPPDLHLSGREAGELAETARVGRLILTHVPPWTDPDAVLEEAKGAFSGEVVLAELAARYEI
ncbi:MAG TPA: MBL fold metallo-hydrolase [Pseudonocardiaceae bacterium]|nr:MBL fold metallo-hydrolase [Pseudonocardiaceae bacterium]